MRGALYNSAYQMALLFGLLVIAILLHFRRYDGHAVLVTLAIAALAAVALALLQGGWVMGGGIDLTFAPFALLLFLVCVAPGSPCARRSIWLWFAAPCIVLVFFVAFPRTHVYVFFAPWMLLAAEIFALAWYAVATRWPQAAQVGAASGATLVAVVTLGGYPYWLYVYNQVEVLHLWNQHAPRFYWSPPGIEAVDGRFGFPFTNGWKAIGALYKEGVIRGDYETNQRHMWIPAWYVPGGERCWSSAEWYFAVDNLEPWMENEEAVQDRLEVEGFALWGVVEVHNAERMQIYHNTASAEPVESVRRLRLEELAPLFDSQADADLPLPWPIVASTPQHFLHVDFGGDIWLEGYTFGS